MKNNKGFTVVELLASFTLTMIIVVFLFEMVLELKDLYYNEKVKSDISYKNSIISTSINQLLDDKAITDLECASNTCTVTTFDNDKTEISNIEVNSNVIIVGNQKFKYDEGITLSDVSISKTGPLNTGLIADNSIIQINYTIKSPYLNKDMQFNYIYSYIEYPENNLISPTFSEKQEAGKSTVTITYPSGCGSDYICTYIKDSGSAATVTSTSASVVFTSPGNVVAQITDGYNVIVVSYTPTLAYSVSAGTVKGGSISLSNKLANHSQTVSFTTSASSGFTYQGATVVCNNNTTIDLNSSTKSFTVSNIACSSAVVYPKWKENDYIWFKQNGTNNVSLWTTTNYDVTKANLYLVSQTDNKYVRFENLSTPDSRNLYATTSKYDLTDYKYWTTSLHCYDSLNAPLETNSGYVKYWKNITSNQSSFETQNASTVTFASNNVDISKYNGSYYLTLHMLVNNTRHWCGWVENYLVGDTYSYTNRS